MKGIDMYTKIQQLKALKYSQRGAAEALGIHRDTVRRYWNMSVEDYEAEVSKIRKVSVLDEYKTVILSWIKANPRVCPKFCVNSKSRCKIEQKLLFWGVSPLSTL